MSDKGVELEVSPAIAELRLAVERVSALQTTHGLTVDMARYDNATQRANELFINGFMDCLPVEPGYEYGNNTYGARREASKLIVSDPAAIRPTMTFGAVASDYHFQHHAGLIIGEKPTQETGVDFTQVLIAGWESQRFEMSEGWRKAVAKIIQLSVPAADWRAKRNKALDLLEQPPSSEDIDRLRDEGDHTYNFGWQGATTVWLTDLHNLLGDKYIKKTSTPRRLHRVLSKTAREYQSATYTRWQERSLLSSDIEQFGVMPRLELIAAAYGVSRAFDEVKAAREAAMPPHPAETAFGLATGYRRIVEESAP